MLKLKQFSEKENELLKKIADRMQSIISVREPGEKFDTMYFYHDMCICCSKNEVDLSELSRASDKTLYVTITWILDSLDRTKGTFLTKVKEGVSHVKVGR